MFAKFMQQARSHDSSLRTSRTAC